MHTEPTQIKGRFVKGKSGNPKGRKPGYQNYVDRIAYIAGEYPLSSLKTIAKDPKKLDKFSAFDAGIIMRLVEGAERNGGLSHDRLLDRWIGKAIQPIAAKVEHTHTIALNGVSGELHALGADDLHAIKAIIDNSATEAEYTEVKE